MKVWHGLSIQYGLRNYSYFQKEFVTPIEKKKDEDKATPSQSGESSQPNVDRLRDQVLKLQEELKRLQREQ